MIDYSADGSDFGFGPARGADQDATAVNPDLSDAEIDRLSDRAAIAADFLKTLGHEGRLMILCHLLTGEKTVTELERLLASRQSAVSQHLARLRFERFVEPRRDGKQIYYRLIDDRVRSILGEIYGMFCAMRP